MTRTEILMTATAFLIVGYLIVSKIEKSSRTFNIGKTEIDMLMPDNSWGAYHRVLTRSPKGDGIFLVLSKDGRTAAFFPWQSIYLEPEYEDSSGIFVIPASRTPDGTRQLFAIFPKYSQAGAYVERYRPKNVSNPNEPRVLITLANCYQFWEESVRLQVPLLFFLLFSLLLTVMSVISDIVEYRRKKKFSLA